MEAKYNYAYTKRLIDDDENGGGGGGDDKNQDQNKEQQGGQDRQNGDQQKDDQQKDDKGQGDDKEQQGDPQQNPAQPDKEQEGDQQGEPQPVPAGISPQEQEQMLDAIQAQEDRTQEQTQGEAGRRGARIEKLVKKRNYAFRITILSVAVVGARADDRLLRVAYAAGRRVDPDFERRRGRARAEDRTLLAAASAVRTAAGGAGPADRGAGAPAGRRASFAHEHRGYRHHAGHRRFGFDAGTRTSAPTASRRPRRWPDRSSRTVTATASDW